MASPFPKILGGRLREGLPCGGLLALGNAALTPPLRHPAGGRLLPVGDRVLHSDSMLYSAIRLLARKRHEPAIDGSRKNPAVFRRRARNERVRPEDGQGWQLANSGGVPQWNEEAGSGVRNERRDAPRSETKARARCRRTEFLFRHGPTTMISPTPLRSGVLFHRHALRVLKWTWSAAGKEGEISCGCADGLSEERRPWPGIGGFMLIGESHVFTKTNPAADLAEVGKCPLQILTRNGLLISNFLLPEPRI